MDTASPAASRDIEEQAGQGQQLRRDMPVFPSGGQADGGGDGQKGQKPKGLKVQSGITAVSTGR